ncbi:metallophosphoesterase [Gryllotalpicola daejeonensis]|uniref:Metallophosphoesterase n=1 Tax=Gryllotalpicola daejeonensis TaxID=993087 RepID=A0ABP7ZNT4_9MICO
MTDTISSTSKGLDFSRRSLLAALGASGAAAVAGVAIGSPANAATPASSAAVFGSSSKPGTKPAGAIVPAVAGLHVTFGADAATEATVSWQTIVPVQNPKVLIAKDGGQFERATAAVTTQYTDAKSGQVVYVFHGRLRNLKPGTDYVYLAVHDGAKPEFGTFRTAPSGRTAFRFTSFGDQGTPTTGKQVNGTWVNDNLGSPSAGDTTAGVESLEPLLHLFNGDLCYANLATDRVRTWSDFWNNNSRSARHRAWMPAPGNHENEKGNGAIGYQAFQTYFDTPRQPGQTDTTAGLWYDLTVGSVKFIFLANDDITYQDAGDENVLGYSHGAQKAWLEATLKAARADSSIDWIVVCMHQVAISTASNFNGADLGIREQWLPLFDKYGVDLVVGGHEHHYERSLAIRGQQANQTKTPIPVSNELSTIDTTKGTVHMVIGGGGTSAPSNQLLYPGTPLATDPADLPTSRVVVGRDTTVDRATAGHYPPIYVEEKATWAGVRDVGHSYGFAAFDVDPGQHAGDLTKITVTYYEVGGPYGTLTPFETFTLQRPRSDAHRR